MGMFVLSERSFWAMDRTKILKISFVFIFANNFGVFQPILNFFFLMLELRILYQRHHFYSKTISAIAVLLNYVKRGLNKFRVNFEQLKHIEMLRFCLWLQIMTYILMFKKKKFIKISERGRKRTRAAARAICREPYLCRPL